MIILNVLTCESVIFIFVKNFFFGIIDIFSFHGINIDSIKGCFSYLEARGNLERADSSLYSKNIERSDNIKSSASINPINNKDKHWLLRVFRFLDINNLRPFEVKFIPYTLPSILSYGQPEDVTPDFETKGNTVNPDYISTKSSSDIAIIDNTCSATSLVSTCSDILPVSTCSARLPVYRSYFNISPLINEIDNLVSDYTIGLAQDPYDDGLLRAGISEELQGGVFDPEREFLFRVEDPFPIVLDYNNNFLTYKDISIRLTVYRELISNNNKNLDFGGTRANILRNHFSSQYNPRLSESLASNFFYIYTPEYQRQELQAFISNNSNSNIELLQRIAVIEYPTTITELKSKLIYKTGNLMREFLLLKKAYNCVVSDDFSATDKLYYDIWQYRQIQLSENIKMLVQERPLNRYI